MNKLIFIFLFIILCSFQGNNKKTTLRWGMIGEKNVMVVDETEILVIEWLEYVFYNDLDKFKSYSNYRSLKIKHLSQAEKKALLDYQIDKRLIPESGILRLAPYNFLFKNSKNKTLIKFRDGLNGPVCIPIDTAGFSNQISNAKIKSRKTIIHALLTLPITGITYEQALGFCKWRNRLEKNRYTNSLNSGFYDARNSEYYTFKLPTKEEHALYNTNLDSICYSKHRKYSRFNYKKSIKKSNTEYPYSKYGVEPVVAYLYSSDNMPYRPRKFIFSGLQHVQGNVAEMTDIKGIASGGSYFHFAVKSYSENTLKYNKPVAWLGFRCIGSKAIFLKQ